MDASSNHCSKLLLVKATFLHLHLSAISKVTPFSGQGEFRLERWNEPSGKMSNMEQWFDTYWKVILFHGDSTPEACLFLLNSIMISADPSYLRNYVKEQLYIEFISFINIFVEIKFFRAWQFFFNISYHCLREGKKKWNTGLRCKLAS